MPLIKCPQCQSFFVSPEQVGERFSCSHCGARLRRQNGNVKRTTTSLKTSPTQPSPTAALQGASVADKPRSKLFVAGIVGIAALVIVGIGLGLAFFVIQSESNPAADHLQAESESPSAEPVTQPATQPQGSNGQPTQPITPPQGSNGQPTQPATPPQGSNGQPTQPATQPQGSNGQPTQPATPPQGSNGQPTPPIQVAHRPLSGDEIYRRLARSAVWILAYDSFEQLAGFGTGALIQEKRKLVLTAYHVIDDASSVFVVFPVFGDEGVPIADVKYYANNFDKLKIRGKVVAQASQHDLALIELESLPDNVAPLPLTHQSVKPGEKLHTIGSSGVKIFDSSEKTFGVLWRYTTGTVRQIREYRGDISSQSLNTHIVESQMATNPGDSGGPVVNDKCELVGVNSWISLKEQNVNAAVDIREVRRFVEDYFTSIGSKWRDIVPAPSTQEAADVLTLVGHLESGDKSTKIKAMVALSEMGSQARLGVNSLLKLLNGSDADLRNVAAVTLEKIGKLTAAEVPVLRQALSTGNLESRRYASAMLARLGPDAEPALADLIQSLEDADSQVRKNSLRAIQQIGSAARTAFVPVLKRLDDEDRGIAQLAAEVLRAYGNPTKQDIPALKRMFTSSRLRTRVQVAALLLRLGDTENVGTLVDALSDKDEALREFALKAIAALKSAELVNCWPKLLPGLRQALANRDRHVKLSAIRILEKAGPEKVVDCVPDLISCLREEDADLQVKAMTTLGMVGSRAKDAVPILDNILQTNKKETRLAAITTLGKIGPEAAVAVPSLILAFEEVETLEPAVDAVARIGKPAVSHLIFALQNPSPRTRYAAALALGRIGPDAKAAIQPLAAIYSRDRFPQVRQAASRALNLIQRKN